MEDFNSGKHKRVLGIHDTTGDEDKSVSYTLIGGGHYHISGEEFEKRGQPELIDMIVPIDEFNKHFHPSE